MKRFVFAAVLLLGACASLNPQQRAEADADRLCGHHVDLTDAGDKKYLQCFSEAYAQLLPAYLADASSRRQMALQSLANNRPVTVQQPVQPYQLQPVRRPMQTNCQTIGGQTNCTTF